MKWMLLLLSFVFVGVVIGGEEPFFATGIVNRATTDNERTPANNIKTEVECKKRSGTWFESSKYDYRYCVVPYSDAGKLCENSNDCIGHCTWPLDKKTPEGILLDGRHGICQLNDDTDDCGRPHFENGEIIFFNCD